MPLAGSWPRGFALTRFNQDHDHDDHDNHDVADADADDDDDDCGGLWWSNLCSWGLAAAAD